MLRVMVCGVIMKLKILYDNEVFLNDIKSDLGFSCFIEKEGVPNILFDTGANSSILLSNMKRLDVVPSSIDDFSYHIPITIT